MVDPDDSRQEWIANNRFHVKRHRSLGVGDEDVGAQPKRAVAQSPYPYRIYTSISGDEAKS
jgi:hypothetical protein